MPLAGNVPDWLFSLVAAVTVFTLMYGIGLALVPGEFRQVWRRPGMIGKGLLSVLVVVPLLALCVARAADLPRPAEVGIVLMSIAPGAPVALQRALDAGGHRTFAPALQITVTVLAVVSMPLSIALLDALYGASASIDPRQLMRQVFLAQLLPLGIGAATRSIWRDHAARIEPVVTRVGTVLLLLLTTLALIDVWQVVIGAGLRVTLAIAVITLLALTAGHLIGGPDPATRTAIAISSAARNAGLALLAATLNAAPPAIVRTVLVYLVVSAFTIVPYVAWRRRAATRAQRIDSA